MAETVGSKIASAEALEVDVSHLENIGLYLNTVADAVTRIRDTTLHEAHRLALIGGESNEAGGGPSALGSQTIDEVAQLATRENGTFTAVDGNLKAVVADLRKTADGIAGIAEHYSSVEERNAVTAAEWTRAISG